MMTSNLISRFLPTNQAGRSIYEDLRAHDQAYDSDVEERAGMTIDEENLGVEFHEHELDNPDLFNDDESRQNSESTAFLPPEQSLRPSRRQKDTGTGMRYNRSPRILDDDGDEDVPMSLLIEGNDRSKPSRRSKANEKLRTNAPIPGPSNREARAHWEAAQAQHPLHSGDDSRLPAYHAPTMAHTGMSPISRQDKALWMWVNAEDLDAFVQAVYEYYVGAGMWCILLDRFLTLLMIIFLEIFIPFLTQCVNFSEIGDHTRLSEILVPKCTQKTSGFWKSSLIVLFTFFTLFKAFQCVTGFFYLRRMHDFYVYCLQIPDGDMQTISWPTVVTRLMALRDANPRTSTQKLSPAQRKWLSSQSKERMSAHDIANRLMRKENYQIALFNKEILDFTLPIPFFRGSQLFSGSLEWTLSYCVMDYFFAYNNQILPLVLKESHRRELIDGLRRRFIFAGFMNLLFIPFIFSYLLVRHFFVYFNEYQKNPSALGARQYTPFAEWKFREFNEVHHLFEERLNMSYPFASRYLEQFPKKKTTQVSKFVAFVAGAIVAVLGLLALLDPENFLGFQITKDRTVLFYIGVFGMVWAVAKGSIPDDNQVFDPEYSLRAVIDYTHYSPPHWTDRLHTDEVKREFSTLYQMKIVVFVMELLGTIFTPFILMLTLPQCSDRIVDFFREFTVHVDGLGYVCSFAVFDFKNGTGRSDRRSSDNTREGKDNLRDEYYSTQHGKMAASYYNFIDNYHINPQTGIPGHVPPSSRRPAQFHPPPSFPGLMSPPLHADMQSSRHNRRPLRGTAAPGSRTPRFPPVANPSPMTSMMLDQQASGRDAKQTSRSQYRSTRNIRQETIEDEEEEEEEEAGMTGTNAFGESGLDESRWETSPTRNASMGGVEGTTPTEAIPQAAGVLDLLYQFQKAHTEGMRGPGGVNF